MERPDEIDHYADRSRLRDLDARVKLICTVSLVVVIALLRGLEPLLVVLAFVFAVAVFSRIPPLQKHTVTNWIPRGWLNVCQCISLSNTPRLAWKPL